MMILLEGTVCPAIILCPCLLARVSNAVRRSLPPSAADRTLKNGVRGRARGTEFCAAALPLKSIKIVAYCSYKQDSSLSPHSQLL
jgi:hypothetical protein